ncbi:hypothetical protein MMC21_001296 [Puttea exsequens]|nr:hypothetical protein [Puttea exsequens]
MANLPQIGSCHYASQPNTFPQLLNCVVEKCNDASLPGHLVGPFGAITAFCSQTTYTIPESAISAMSVAAEEAKKTLSAPHMLGTQKPTQAAGWKSGHKYSGTAHAMVDGGGILTPPMVLLIQSTAFDAASTSAMSTASAQTSSSSADSQIATAPATTPSIPAASTTSSKAATTSTGGGILLDRARVDSMRLLGMIGLFGLGAWFLAAYI